MYVRVVSVYDICAEVCANLKTQINYQLLGLFCASSLSKNAVLISFPPFVFMRLSPTKKGASEAHA